MGKEFKSVDRELALLEWEVETAKHNMSLQLSLLMPFILSFFSISLAVDSEKLKLFFLVLSILLMFLLAGLVFFDVQRLKARYKQKRDLLLKRFE